jgi:hypothetical protein
MRADAMRLKNEKRRQSASASVLEEQTMSAPHRSMLIEIRAWGIRFNFAPVPYHRENC